MQIHVGDPVCRVYSCPVLFFQFVLDWKLSLRTDVRFSLNLNYQEMQYASEFS